MLCLPMEYKYGENPVYFPHKTTSFVLKISTVRCSTAAAFFSAPKINSSAGGNPENLEKFELFACFSSLSQLAYGEGDGIQTGAAESCCPQHIRLFE